AQESFNGAVDGHRRRARNPAIVSILSRLLQWGRRWASTERARAAWSRAAPTRFNGAVDGHRRRDAPGASQDAPVAEASMGPSMGIDGKLEMRTRTNNPRLTLQRGRRWASTESQDLAVQVQRQALVASMGPSMGIDGEVVGYEACAFDAPASM